MTAPRTQEQILARFQEAAEDDLFGFRREVLALAMTADTIRQALPKVEDPEDAAVTLGLDQLADEAREYLAFAIEKILNHRGISASRSVDKLTEYAWLLGRDDVVQAMAEAEYPQYGAPKVRAFATGMGWPFLEASDDSPAAREVLERMSIGRLCDDECMDGCGR